MTSTLPRDCHSRRRCARCQAGWRATRSRLRADPSRRTDGPGPEGPGDCALHGCRSLAFPAPHPSFASRRSPLGLSRVALPVASDRRRPRGLGSPSASPSRAGGPGGPPASPGVRRMSAPPPLVPLASTPHLRRGVRQAGDQPARSCSVRAVSHRFDGFLRARARRSVAPCSRSWGSRPVPGVQRSRYRGIVHTVTLLVRATLRSLSSSTAVPRHRGLCPPDVASRTLPHPGQHRCAWSAPSPRRDARTSRGWPPRLERTCEARYHRRGGGTHGNATCAPTRGRTAPGRSRHRVAVPKRPPESPGGARSDVGTVAVAFEALLRRRVTMSRPCGSRHPFLPWALPLRGSPPPSPRPTRRPTTRDAPSRARNTT